jgi:hypothetical protein
LVKRLVVETYYTILYDTVFVVFGDNDIVTVRFTQLGNDS